MLFSLCGSLCCQQWILSIFVYWWAVVDVCVWECTLLIRNEKYTSVILILHSSPLLSEFAEGKSSASVSCSHPSSGIWTTPIQREQDCVSEYTSEKHISRYYIQRDECLFFVVLPTTIIWCVCETVSQRGYLLISMSERTAVLIVITQRP